MPAISKLIAKSETYQALRAEAAALGERAIHAGVHFHFHVVG